jgi:hypothetical protein
VLQFSFEDSVSEYGLHINNGLQQNYMEHVGHGPLFHVTDMYPKSNSRRKTLHCRLPQRSGGGVKESRRRRHATGLPGAAREKTG